MRLFYCLLTIGILFTNINLSHGQIIFEDNFEDELFLPEWQPMANLQGASGLVAISTALPFAGDYGAIIGKSSDAGGFTVNGLDLHLDLSEYEQVELTFKIRDPADANNEEDGLYFSDNGGIDFVKVYDFRPQSWCEIYGEFPPFDVDKLATNAGLHLTNEFVIRFQQAGTDDFSGNLIFGQRHGFYLDNVSVVVPDLTYAAIPFVDNFEADELHPAWQRAFADSTSFNLSTTTNEIARITDGVGLNSSRGLSLGKTCDSGLSSSAIDLHLNLEGLSDVELTFWIRDLADGNNDAEGLYFSDNGGADFTKV